MTVTTTILETATTIASSAVNNTGSVTEAPAWTKYIVDIVLLAAFFFIFFFIKPDQNAELISDEEAPNELEKILKTDTHEDNKNSESSGSLHENDSTDSSRDSSSDDDK